MNVQSREMTRNRLLLLALVTGLFGACGGAAADTNATTPPDTPEPTTTTQTTRSDPSVAAASWILAVSMGDLETAQSLLAPRSAAYAESVGGLKSMMSDLAEGWGAWALATDTTYRTVETAVEDRPVTLVIVTGTVAREGPPARSATTLLISDGLADPFAAIPPVGFVVPRAEFVDRLASDIAFEVAVPKTHRCTFLLDDTRLESGTTAPSGRTVLSPAAPPTIGQHVLTAVCIGENESVGAVSVRFETVG